MSRYWTRIGFAYLLLWFASRVMKDAERLLKETVIAGPTEEELIEGTASDEPAKVEGYFKRTVITTEVPEEAVS